MSLRLSLGRDWVGTRYRGKRRRKSAHDWYMRRTISIYAGALLAFLAIVAVTLAATSILLNSEIDRSSDVG